MTASTSAAQTTQATQRLSIEAPAKFNVFLSVASPARADGYHDIASLVVPLTLHDTLTVETGLEQAEALCFGCTDPSLETPDNLVVKAANRFLADLEKTHPTLHAHPMTLHLTKRIPTQAGLGGGSTDAAATLIALNLLHGDPFSHADLLAIGAALGADVPCCLAGGLVWMEGRGERITPVSLDPDAFEALSATPLLLVKPPSAMATAEAYTLLDAKLNAKPDTARPFLRPPPFDPQHPPKVWPDWDSLLHNDFHNPVFAHLDDLRTLARVCTEVGLARYQLSGSGSAVVIFLDETQAEAQTTALTHHLKQAVGHTFAQWFLCPVHPAP
ncbi:MAG: 4-(cytidine 5'-diphospho)-2-C-methyl-D-erythritol kinase [Cyanobacteria bacterium HKST-UBA06]|nr:4-(cytidine 5'-diphospho)-2-C-methyl-D-erythritol kinase [Cyanobacteria bacterium HKST-UBA06]